MSSFTRARAVHACALLLGLSASAALALSLFSAPPSYPLPAQQVALRPALAFLSDYELVDVPGQPGVYRVAAQVSPGQLSKLLAGIDQLPGTYVSSLSYDGSNLVVVLAQQWGAL